MHKPVVKCQQRVGVVVAGRQTYVVPSRRSSDINSHVVSCATNEIFICAAHGATASILGDTGDHVASPAAAIMNLSCALRDRRHLETTCRDTGVIS